jgi:hypothetical protein
MPIAAPPTLLGAAAAPPATTAPVLGAAPPASSKTFTPVIPPTVNNTAGLPVAAPNQTNPDGSAIGPALSVNAPGGPGSATPTAGNFGVGVKAPQALQQGAQKWSIPQDVNYSDYRNFGNESQQYGLQAGTTLNDPRVQASIDQQNALAQGPSAAQSHGFQTLGGYASGTGAGQQDQNASLGILRNAASGNGPSAAQAQLQSGVDQSIRAQQAQANSARGNGLANAQLQAQQTGAQMQGQAASQSAALRAQEMQAAQSTYAGAAGQAANTAAGSANAYLGAANQAQTGQVQAAAQAEASNANEQNLAMNYYTGQQGALQSQSQFAGNLAQAQVANDYGLSGTELQTQTQQHIANQNNQTQTDAAVAGATAAAIGLVASASTGGSEAAARGARDAGADPHASTLLGAHIGQAIGDSRGIRTPATEQADALAAARVAGAPPARGIPSTAAYEPLADTAYRLGAREAARMRARPTRLGGVH